MQKIKTMLENRLSAILLALMIIQPMLDVFSYFLGRSGSNALSTLLRVGLLALVALLGFILSDKKQAYLILYAVVAVFWTAHMLNCKRIGYISVVQDTGSLLRLLNFPLYTLTFITALRKRPELRQVLYLGVAAAFGEILLFTALPWLSGHPVYTYEGIGVDRIGVGVLGWFAVPSAQSAIIVLTAPFFLYWTYRSGKYPLYLVGAALPLLLMFLTGTKLNFYSIFIVCGAYIFLFALQLGKKSLRYVLPLVALAVLVVVLRHQSPMAVRNRLTDYSQNVYSSMIEESLENSGADATTRRIIENGGKVEEDYIEMDPPEKQIERLRRVLLGIYADDGVYGWRTKDLNERFGVYNVMEVYHHTDAPGALSDSRQLKKNYAKLMWQEKDFLTHLLGFEYSDFLLGGATYDLENDFPGVFYNIGYLGFGLYLAFLALFFVQLLCAFFREVQSQWRSGQAGEKPVSRLKAFFLGLRGFLTLEMGVVGMSFLLAVIAAQISGNVLRRPNVTIYFAVAAACVYSLTACRSKDKGEKPF